MNVEGAKSVFEIGGVVLLLLTFFSGAGAWWTGRKVNEKQAQQLRDFEKSLALAQKDVLDAKAAQQIVELNLEKQKEITAKAQEQLLELAKRQAPRFIQNHALSSLLKGKSAGVVRILYQPNDPEAYWYAFYLMAEINDGGWKVPTLPEPIPDNLTPRTPGFSDEDMQAIAAHNRQLPIAMRVGSGAGLTLLAHSLEKTQPADSSYQVLYHALSSLKLINAMRLDIDLPPDYFILVVGPKP